MWCHQMKRLCKRCVQLGRVKETLVSMSATCLEELTHLIWIQEPGRSGQTTNPGSHGGLGRYVSWMGSGVLCSFRSQHRYLPKINKDAVQWEMCEFGG